MITSLLSVCCLRVKFIEGMLVLLKGHLRRTRRLAVYDLGGGLILGWDCCRNDFLDLFDHVLLVHVQIAFRPNHHRDPQ